MPSELTNRDRPGMVDDIRSRLDPEHAEHSGAIEASSAASNRFFSSCHDGLPSRDIFPFIRNWHAITRSFCLGSLQYVAVLARQRQSTSNDRFQVSLENALAVAIEISAGEFGFGRFGRQGFHYNMFARLGGLQSGEPPIGRSDNSTAPETTELIEWFTCAFADVHMGAGVLRVVERTAFRIVEAMNRIFPEGLSREEGWSEYQREYITMHLKIEPIHADTVETLVDSLAWSQGARQSIDSSSTRTCELFGYFWERMALDVFGPEVGAPGGGVVVA